MASGPYERFYPGEARGLIDPTWPGVTERGVQETWGRNLASFNERQREKKRERVREVYGTVPPPKRRGLLDSEPYTSEWFEGMSDRAYVDSGLLAEHMVGPTAGVTQKIRKLVGSPTGYDQKAIRELAEKFIRPSGTKDISEKVVYTTKLFKLRKDGTLGPLYIGSKQRIDSKGGEWLPFDEKLTKKGFGERPGWHAPTKEAPHIKTEAKGQDRVVRDVALRNWTVFPRPASQGSEWYLAGEMMVLPVKAAKKKKKK